VVYQGLCFVAKRGFSSLSLNQSKSENLKIFVFAVPC